MKPTVPPWLGGLVLSLALGLPAIVAGQSQQPAASPQLQSPPRRETADRRSRRVRLPEVRLASPDGRIEFVLLPNPERLSYTVTLDGAAAIEPSVLRFLLDGYDLTAGVIFGNVTRGAVQETYVWRGAKGTATNHCQTATVALTHDLSFLTYRLELRAFDDGVAYRFVVPGTPEAERVPEELSEFVLPAGTTVWYHDLDGHYEAEYREQDIAEVPAGQWAGPPVTFRLPGGRGYGALAEANLVDYSGMALEADGRRSWMVGLGHRQPVSYPFELRYGREAARRLGRPAAIHGPLATPWRVVMLGRDLNTLVNSTLLPNLCPPADRRLFPQGFDTPWVEPGLAVWDYVDRNYAPRQGGCQLERMKEFSRLGGLLGARYHILEGFAYGWSDAEIRDFIEYSNRQGVRALFWRHSRDLRTPEAREEFFGRLQRLGVAGAKVDFFDHEAKELVDLYEALLAEAAAHRLVLNFHGANKPTGRMRTWPNEMIREAVRGMESSRLAKRARHEAILPFTRYLAGPADYTTMIFTSRRTDSTWAHQIAALATFASPILTIAAHPQSVLDNPAVEVIKSIPAVWDETRVLPESCIGELSLFARRKGRMWMLAALAGSHGCTVQVPLSFLGPGDYQATLVRDTDGSPTAVQLETRTLRSSDSLQLRLRDGGGFVGRFVQR